MKCHLLDIDISSISWLPQTLDFCWLSRLTLHFRWFRWFRWQQQSSSCFQVGPCLVLHFGRIMRHPRGSLKWLGDIPKCHWFSAILCVRPVDAKTKSLCWMNPHRKSLNLVQERAGCFWSAYSKNSLRKLQIVVACWSSARVEPLVWWLKDTTSRRSTVFNHGKPI